MTETIILSFHYCGNFG